MRVQRGHRSDAKRSRRLRKKLRVDALQVLGFSCPVTRAGELSEEARDAFLERFLAKAIEANDLTFGGNWDYTTSCVGIPHKRQRRAAADSHRLAARPIGFVVDRQPFLGNAVGLAQRLERIGIQHFQSAGAVELFDVGVLCRAAGLDTAPGRVRLRQFEHARFRIRRPLRTTAPSPPLRGARLPNQTTGMTFAHRFFSPQASPPHHGAAPASPLFCHDLLEQLVLRDRQ